MVEQLRKPTRRKRHTIAATFYLVMAVVGLVVAVTSSPAALVVTVIAGLYSAYLFRGGRIVVWIW